MACRPTSSHGRCDGEPREESLAIPKRYSDELRAQVVPLCQKSDPRPVEQSLTQQLGGYVPRCSAPGSGWRKAHAVEGADRMAEAAGIDRLRAGNAELHGRTRS